MPARRRSRLGLYAPILLLLGLAAAWSIGWFVIREKTRAGLDDWIAGEAAAGRRWSCADRGIGGYPFRIEVTCSEFTLDRPDVHASLGRLLVVSQVYRPRHIIAEAQGPLQIAAGPTKAAGTWRLLQASVIAADRGFERLSLVVDAPAVKIEGPQALDLSSRRFEAHLRPDPAKPDAYDLAVESLGAIIPGLDGMVGGTEPADIRIGLDVTQARDLPARPLPSELERWRLAGGKVEVNAITLAKGPRRAEAKGAIGIDDLHRPQGRVDLSAVNLGGMIGRLLGNGAGLNLLSALLGAPPSAAPDPQRAPGGDAPLRPLPPLVLDNGRVYFGPLAIPGFRLTPLY